MKHHKSIYFLAAFVTLILTTASLSASAADIDWNSVTVKKVKVFYPGQASWDFLRDQDHGTGAAVVRTHKKACAECHVGENGEYDVNADKIITGELKKDKSKVPFEPQGMPGAKGFKDVSLQAAYDAQNLYLRLQWPGSGASVADPSLGASDKADRVSIQIANKIGTFKKFGCFITCHDDESGMPANRGDKVTLYGYYTRDKHGNMKPQSTLDGYMEKGQFIDLIEAAFVGKDVKTEDMHILGARDKDHNDVTATGSYADGTYTVVITRKLNTGDAKDITLEDGKDFDIGIAIHDNKNNERRHYVSFPLSIGLSAPADVAAKKF